MGYKKIYIKIGDFSLLKTKNPFLSLIPSHLSHSCLKLGFDILEIMAMHSLVTYFDFYFQFLVIFKNGLVQNYDHDQTVRK